MATITILPRGLRITPDTPAEEAALEAVGWVEGGDWLPLVRQDRPGQARIRFLQVVRDPAQLDRAQFQPPKPLSVYDKENG